MNIAILDDWFDTLRRLPCFPMLSHPHVIATPHRVVDPQVEVG